MQAEELLKACAFELNDLEPGHEYTRFPQDELITYLNEGLAQLAALKPLLFRSIVTLPLGAGAQQKVPDYVDSIEDLTFNVNPDDSLGQAILPGDFNLERTYGKGVCPPAGDYAVRSYAPLPSSSAFFYVDPPVPPGQTVRVQAVVTMVPQVITTANTPIELPSASPLTYRNHLKDWMLYRAFAKDTESQTSMQLSQAHFKAFYTALGTPQRNEQGVPLAAQGKLNGASAQ